MIEKKTKIMVLPPPTAGHMNPLCGIINELCKHNNIEVIMYSDEEYRGVVENLGAQFRRLCKKTFSEIKIKPINEKPMMINEILDHMITFGNDLLPQLIGEFEKEQFDIIIYDAMFLPAKYLIEVIKARYAKGEYTKLPKTVSFAPNFPMCDKMVKEVRKNTQEDIWSMLGLVNCFKRQIVFSWNYGISVYNPLKLLTTKNEEMNIVAVIPEMQPYREDFDDTFKFVGPCVSEEARSVEITNDPELKSMLGQFDTKRPDRKLIFMSLGTMFNANFFVFERVIDGFKQFNKNPNRHVDAAHFKMIMALGDASFQMLKEKLSSGELKLPENILVRTKVPQLEVLKRADLFITHCGFNSTTETIKYSVPVVAIPINADQPLNAKHICDELSFGVRLDPRHMSVSDIADAIDQVLSDVKYKRNIDAMSKTMAKYNGAVEGAKLILDYVNQNDRL